MHIMSRIAVACSATLLLAACAKSDQAAKDSAAGVAAAAAPAPAPAPAPALALADVAGKWQMRAVPESGSGTDTSATNYVLTATADTTGWVITYPSGLKVPVHVMVSGDSVIMKTGSFASQRRKNVKVSTDGALRLQNGKLVGTTIGHYAIAGPDSVLHLHAEGTKMP
jgi:hypothetical protein